MNDIHICLGSSNKCCSHFMSSVSEDPLPIFIFCQIIWIWITVQHLCRVCCQSVALKKKKKKVKVATAENHKSTSSFLGALDLSSESGCDQIIHNHTHKSGNCLDLIFTDTVGVVVGNVESPIFSKIFMKFQSVFHRFVLMRYSISCLMILYEYSKQNNI